MACPVKIVATILLTFTLCACVDKSGGSSATLPVNQRSSCVLVYSEADYGIHHVIPKTLFAAAKSWDELNSEDIRNGSAIAVSTGGRRYIVTAAHVATRVWPEAEAVANSRSGSLLNGSYRIRVSSLAYVPLRLYVDPAMDIAVLEMPADFWDKLDVIVFPIAQDSPHPGDAVNIWGFPVTVVPQLQDGVKVVLATEEMLVLNKPLDGGFSGGPVIGDRDGRLLGMVLRSTDRQSRALPSGRVIRALTEFDQKAINYTDPMEVIR